ncbi:MAG: hypothetical protein ABSG11_21960 [Candidatus Korobacteraceae bacterium]
MTTLLMSKIRAAVVVASLAVPSGSTVLYAQYQRIQVDIPFAFEVGSAHFAPGTYFLNDSQQYFLTVRGPSGTALAMDRREASLSPATKGKVVFHRYGNRYFLREVWVKGETDHLRCPESKAERRVRKIQQEANHAAIVTPSNVEIALLQNPR